MLVRAITYFAEREATPGMKRAGPLEAQYVELMRSSPELYESVATPSLARLSPAEALVSSLAQQWCVHETHHVGPIRLRCHVVGSDAPRLDGFWRPRDQWESAPISPSVNLKTVNSGSARSELWSTPGLVQAVATTVQGTPGCAASADASLLDSTAPPDDSRWARRAIAPMDTLIRALRGL